MALDFNRLPDNINIDFDANLINVLKENYLLNRLKLSLIFIIKNINIRRNCRKEGLVWHLYLHTQFVPANITYPALEGYKP